MTATSQSRLQLGRFRQIVTDAPVSYSVYSAFSFYGTRRGGELPGTWLSAALGALGHQLPAIRQTLYRMESSEELVSRTTGRNKVYRLTGYARAEAEAGLAKIMDHQEPMWDGYWTMVQFQTGGDDRVERERLRSILQVEGFAQLGAGSFIHPRDRSDRLLAAAMEHGVAETIEVFRAQRVGVDHRAFVARFWDLESIAARYKAFLDRYQRVERALDGFPPRSAFVLRFAMVFEYLEIAWQDPGLGRELLPPAWPGERARQLARSLYSRLLPGAIAFADSLM